MWKRSHTLQIVHNTGAGAEVEGRELEVPTGNDRVTKGGVTSNGPKEAIVGGEKITVMVKIGTEPSESEMSEEEILAQQT